MLIAVCAVEQSNNSNAADRLRYSRLLCLSLTAADLNRYAASAIADLVVRSPIL